MALTTVELGPFTQGEVPESLLVRVMRPLKDGSGNVAVTLYGQTPAYTATAHLDAPDATTVSFACNIYDPSALPTDFPDDFAAGEEGWVEVPFATGHLDQVGDYTLQIIVENIAAGGSVRLKSTDVWQLEVNDGPAAAVGA